MKVLVLTGSPHKKGTTNVLAEAFCTGVVEAGGEAVRIDAALQEINPCRGCDYCKSRGVCVQKDDMQEVSRQVLEADAIALISPIYFFGMTAQIKAVIDRLYATYPAFQQKGLHAALICAGGDTEEWVMQGAVANYEALCRYLNWQDRGRVFALGAQTKEDLKQTYIDAAQSLGRNM